MTKDETRWQALFNRRTELEIIELFKTFRSGGIEPILIKGWAAAQNYPANHQRYFSDHDIAVSPHSFAQATRLLSSRERNFRVDLHAGLKTLDTKDWPSVFGDSQVSEVSGFPIRIPCAEDHLRILCVHWLSDGGINRERLWDIFYAVQNRPADFSWDKCLSETSVVRRRWITSAIGLARRYLNLDTSDLPFAKETEDLPTWLTETVEAEWERGVKTIPFFLALRDPKHLLPQLKKRLRPNPIQSTIEFEGDFDDQSRVGFQLRRLFFNAIPGLTRIRSTIFR